MQNGIWCLQKLRVVMNPGGASTGVRSFIKSDLFKYAQQHNHLKIDVVNSTDLGSHPKLIGFFNNGRKQTISLRNKSPKEVLHFCETLRQRKGNELAKVRWANALSQKPSFQVRLRSTLRSSAL